MKQRHEMEGRRTTAMSDVSYSCQLATKNTGGRIRGQLLCVRPETGTHSCGAHLSATYKL